jgi:cyclophilin family peptidyl-prolyl cis-trans isomerase
VRRGLTAAVGQATGAAWLLATACTPGQRPAGVGADDPAERVLLREPARVVAGARAPAEFSVRFETSQGAFIVLVHRSWAPFGADRFHALVRHGFFDDQRFFRVRAGFIAQFGLSGDPAVSSAWQGQTMPDDPRVASNRRGTLAYAFTTPGTRSTQIFINLADNLALDDEGFAPFGEIVDGVAVIDRLYAGYGESAGGGMRGGRQGRIVAEGNAHLRREFPRLDFIRTARLASRE